jgi:hypothetical protein
MSPLLSSPSNMASLTPIKVGIFGMRDGSDAGLRSVSKVGRIAAASQLSP